jgi:hypothetical protein
MCAARVVMLACRAETVRLQKELAIRLQGKLSSTESADSMRGPLPWEISGCRARAASCLRQHAYSNRHSPVEGVVNEAMKLMGHSIKQKKNLV